MDFEVTEAAKEFLAREGFDPQYGARPLRRAVQRLVEDPLAEEILLGKFLANDTVVVDTDRRARHRLPQRRSAGPGRRVRRGR